MWGWLPAGRLAIRLLEIVAPVGCANVLPIPAPPIPAPSLLRSMRRWDLVAVVLNGVIGAGP
jgi:hypothetical protein